MLLQVDFETLKVENHELRTQLLRALRRLDANKEERGKEVKKEASWV